MTRKQTEGALDNGAADRALRDPLMSMTAALRRSSAETRYRSNAQRSPTAAAILTSMSPETRRYTESVMNLTFEQLAAGAAGQP